MTRLSLRPSASPSLRSGPRGSRPSLRMLYRALGAGLLGLGLMMVVGAGPAEARGGGKSPAIRCAKAISTSVSRMSQRLSSQGYRRCLLPYQRGKLKGTLESCLMGDPARMFKRLGYDPTPKVERACAKAPDFLEPDSTALKAAAFHTTARFWREMFGADIDATLVTRAEDRGTARCQRALVSSGRRCLRSHHQALNRCLADGLESAEDLEACVTEVASRSCNVERKLESACGAGTTKRAAGSRTTETPAQAVTRHTACHACLMTHTTMHPTMNCDLVDDQMANHSCDAPSCTEKPILGQSPLLADGGVLQMNCPYLPNTTPWNNRRDATREDQSRGYGMAHFAWNSFMALNWPAKEPGRHSRPASAASSLPTRGIPDTTKSFKNASATDLAVWETFKEKREVFHRGRCEAPVYNFNFNDRNRAIDFKNPQFVFVGCSSDQDCERSGTGYSAGNYGSINANLSTHYQCTQTPFPSCDPHDASACSAGGQCVSAFVSRARTNLGKCLVDRPPVLGSCQGNPTQGCSVNIENLKSQGRRGSPECPGQSECIFFTANSRGTNVCSADGHSQARFCAQPETNGTPRLCKTDQDCGSGSGSCLTDGRACHTDTDCGASTGYKAPICLYDGTSPQVRAHLDGNNQALRSEPSKTWGGFPQYTPQGAVGQKPIAICEGHEEAMANLGHERHMGSPRKFNSLDETVEVHSEARESFTELCQGTKWCRDVTRNSWIGACKSDKDCPGNKAGSCQSVTNPEETCAVAATSRQIKHACSLDTSIQCSPSTPCAPRHGECILVQNAPRTFDAPPCCRTRGSYVAPRVWKGDPATGRTCSTGLISSPGRTGCRSDSDCVQPDGVCQPGPTTGRPVYYEVKVNYDYFNYIMKASSAGSPPIALNRFYLNTGIGTGAYYGDFRLPSRTSLDRTIPVVLSDALPVESQADPENYEVWNYNAQTCLNNFGHERRCSAPHQSQACNGDSDCSGGQCNHSASDAAPCRTGALQIKAAWHKLHGVCSLSSSQNPISCETDATCSHHQLGNCDFTRDGISMGRKFKTVKAIYHEAMNERKTALDMNVSRETICKAVGTFGLVGLHIIQRTHQRYKGDRGSIPASDEYSQIGNNFIFATWEHKGNYDVCSNDAERDCHTSQDCSQGGTCVSADYRYANHYEGIGENRLYDEQFTPSHDAAGQALPLKRLQRKPSTATTVVNEEVYKALGCPDSNPDTRSVWCDYRLVGIQFIATDPDGSFAGHSLAGAAHTSDINGSVLKMCYLPGMNYTPTHTCRTDSDCHTESSQGSHFADFGTCLPVPQGDSDQEQDYLLANLVLESNLGLQYFKGLPPKVFPSKKRQDVYKSAEGHCQSDPRIACTGGTCSNSPSTSCYLDDDCDNGTCTRSCTQNHAPIESVCLQNHDYRCGFDMLTECPFPGDPSPVRVGTSEICAPTLKSATGIPPGPNSEVPLYVKGACSNEILLASPKEFRRLECVADSDCKVCQGDHAKSCMANSDCVNHGGGDCVQLQNTCTGAPDNLEQFQFCQNDHTQSCIVHSDCANHGGGGCIVKPGVELDIPLKTTGSTLGFCRANHNHTCQNNSDCSIPPNPAHPAGISGTCVPQTHRATITRIEPPAPSDVVHRDNSWKIHVHPPLLVENAAGIQVTPSNPLCLAVPKPCVRDSDCRGSLITDRFHYDICLNHCAPPNSNTLFPVATVCSNNSEKKCGNDDECGTGAQCIGRGHAFTPNPMTYQFAIEPRAGIPYGRDKKNVFFNNELKNMGGCMGCHGVADTLGFEFSFVAQEGQRGVPIQADNDNPSFGEFESFRSRRSSVR